MNMDKKLAPHFAWLFGLAAVALGVAFSFLLVHHTWKTASIAIGLSFAICGVASSWLTRATTPQAVIPMVVAALGIGAIYFIVVKRALDPINHTLATGLAAWAAIKVLAVTLAAGIGGAVGGFKLREVKSLGDLVKKPG
jgi:hypothetical protein